MDTKRKWFSRSGAIAGGIVAGVLAIGTAFGVVAVTNSSSTTGEQSPIASTEPTDDPLPSEAPVFEAPGASASPDTDDDAQGVSASASPDDDDDDASPGPSSSPDDDDGDDDSSPEPSSSPDDDDKSGHGGDDSEDDDSGHGSDDDD